MFRRIIVLAIAFALTVPSLAFAASSGTRSDVGPRNTTTTSTSNSTTTSTSTSTSTSNSSSTYNTNRGNVVIGDTTSYTVSGCFGTVSFSGSRVSNQSDLELLLYGASNYSYSGQQMSDAYLCAALGHGDVFYNNDGSASNMGSNPVRNLDATHLARTDVTRTTSQQVTTQTTQQVTTQVQTITVGDFVLGVNTNTNTNTNVNANTNTNTNSNYNAVYEHLTGTAVTNVYQVNGTYRYSPIVLDLSGTGRLDASAGNWMPHQGVKGNRLTKFDLLGTGNMLITEWVGPKAGLLIEPRTDGTVDGSCLFGNAGGYSNGYEKLSVRDANNDSKLTGAELKGLAVWVDANGNGRLDAGELKSLKSLGITEIGTRHSGMRSSFVMNGKTAMTWDWWPTALDVRQVATLRK